MYVLVLCVTVNQIAVNTCVIVMTKDEDNNSKPVKEDPSKEQLQLEIDAAALAEKTLAEITRCNHPHCPFSSLTFSLLL